LTTTDETANAFSDNFQSVFSSSPSGTFLFTFSLPSDALSVSCLNDDDDDDDDDKKAIKLLESTKSVGLHALLQGAALSFVSFT
jgi:hypothetical protein